MKDTPLSRLGRLGQSVWLGYIRRDLIAGGELRRLIADDGLSGMTSNPAIIQKAIVESHDYDGDVRAMALTGKTVHEMFEALSQRDVQGAADEFRPLEIQAAVRHADNDLGAAVGGQRGVNDDGGQPWKTSSGFSW